MTNAPTVVCSYSDAVSAHVAHTRLEAEGIRAFVVDENQVTTIPVFSIALGGVKVLVADDDLEAARELLERKANVDNQTCPSCGSSKLTRHLLGRRSAFLTTLFLGIPIGRSRAKVQCEDCEHAWRE